MRSEAYRSGRLRSSSPLRHSRRSSPMTTASWVSPRPHSPGAGPARKRTTSGSPKRSKTAPESPSASGQSRRPPPPSRVGACSPRPSGFTEVVPHPCLVGRRQRRGTPRPHRARATQPSNCAQTSQHYLPGTPPLKSLSDRISVGSHSKVTPMGTVYTTTHGLVAQNVVKVIGGVSRPFDRRVRR